MQTCSESGITPKKVGMLYNRCGSIVSLELSEKRRIDCELSDFNKKLKKMKKMLDF